MLETIDKHIAKYMAMLGFNGPKPIVKLKDNLGSRWLGRCVWRASEPKVSVVEIQKSILADPRTLERVVAHEVVHHVNFMSITEKEISIIRLGIRPEGHGPDFMKGAAKINSVMGDGFVTVKSDQEYVQSENLKPFYVFIHPIYQRLGWSWAVRLSPESKTWLKAKIADGSKLVMSTDRRWTVGGKITKRYGGVSVPKVGSETETLLKQLFASAPGVALD